MTQAQRNWWEIDESRPYGFVSYAHYDRKKVDPIAYRLIRDGYPVWMDHDIVSGADWSEYIAEHLKNASYAIIFLSESSIRSGNVRDEINFARNEGKPLIVVYLEDVSGIMPKGLHLSLDRFQAVDAYRLSSEETVHDLEDAVTFRKRRKQKQSVQRKQNPSSEPDRRNSRRQQAKKKKKSSAPLIACIAVIIIAVLVLALLVLRNPGNSSSGVSENDSSPDPTEETVTQPDTEPEQNNSQSTKKNVQVPAENTTDYTFSSAVLSSRFGMSADEFRSFVAQQGVQVSGLTSQSGNAVLSVTDDQKNALIQALENNAATAASQVNGDVTSASYENGYAGVDLTISADEVSSDDQAMADTLKSYGILIQVLNGSSSSFKVTFNDADGNLISTETY